MKQAVILLAVGCGLTKVFRRGHNGSSFSRCFCSHHCCPILFRGEEPAYNPQQSRLSFQARALAAWATQELSCATPLRSAKAPDCQLSARQDTTQVNPKQRKYAHYTSSLRTGRIKKALMENHKGCASELRFFTALERLESQRLNSINSKASHPP